MTRCLAMGASVLLAASAWAAVEVADGVSVSRDEMTRVVTVAYRLTATDGETEGIVTADLIASDGSVIEGALANAEGDVFRRVCVGEDLAFTWKPDAVRFAGAHAGCSFKLTAWSVSAPPDYLAIDLLAAQSAAYYANAGQVPGGVKDRAYFLDKLLMRKIPAAYVKWHQGKASPEAYTGEQLQRWTTLTEDYYIGVYELTRGQHLIVQGSKKGSFSTLRNTDNYLEMPFQGQNVDSFRGSETAVSPTSWLGLAAARTGFDLDLPTAAQWEYACRAGTSGATYGPIADVAVYQSNAPKNAAGTRIPAHGGTKLPNAWGLYDTLGNIWEMCNDWMDPGAHLDGAEATDPTGPAEYINFNTRSEELGHRVDRGGAGKMWRGGTYDYGSSYATVTYPYGWAKWGTLSPMQGFRLVCPVK